MNEDIHLDGERSRLMTPAVRPRCPHASMGTAFREEAG